MFELPMFPGWDAIHPMLIHFPLALFFLVPVFVLMAAFTKAATRRTFLLSSLIVMLLGTIAINVAHEAGQSAAAAAPAESASIVLEHHRELAALARSSLTLATLLFGVTLLLSLAFHLPLKDLSALLPLGSVAFYALGLLWLIRAAYQGERLVHEFGIGVRP